MADSNFRGPLTSMGSMEDINQNATGSLTPVPISPFDGPSIFYQGYMIPDPRAVPFAKDGLQPARQFGALSLGDSWAVDQQPQAATTNLLSAAQALTAGTPIVFNSVQTTALAAGGSWLTYAIPIQPQNTSNLTTANVVLDFGFTSGTTVANSSTVNCLDNTQLSVGQWIIIGGVGNSGGTAPLFTQVQSIATTNLTGATVGPNLPAAALNAPIGAGNLFGSSLLPYGTPFGPANASASHHIIALAAGLARVYNPREGVARNLSVTIATTTATTTIEFFGWDVWKQPMTESITIPSANRVAAGSTFFGAKAWKYVQSASVSTTAGGTATIGIGDVFGFPARIDHFEQSQMFWNGCQVPTSVGFNAAATTPPATNTTGDVRGTIQVSTLGTGSAAAVATAAVSNGTARLAIIQNPGVWNQITCTPNNLTPFFGLAQSTT